MKLECIYHYENSLQFSVKCWQVYWLIGVSLDRVFIRVSIEQRRPFHLSSRRMSCFVCLFISPIEWEGPSHSHSWFAKFSLISTPEKLKAENNCRAHCHGWGGLWARKWGMWGREM